MELTTKAMIDSLRACHDRKCNECCLTNYDGCSSDLTDMCADALEKLWNENAELRVIVSKAQVCTDLLKQVLSEN